MDLAVTFGYSHFSLGGCGGFFLRGIFEVEDQMSGNSLWILGEAAECAPSCPNIGVDLVKWPV